MASPEKTLLRQLKFLGKNSSEMRLAAEKWPSKFQTLISIILSARTRDEVTISTCKKLFKKYPTAEKLSKVKIKDIQKIIKPINFHKNKSRHIINCAKRLVADYGGKVPHDFEKLIELPGVGRKTANVFLAEYGDSSIGVDTHVNHISRKLGWTNHPESKPHKIEEDLRKLFPKKYWGKLNQTLVRFGKTHTSRTKKDKILEEIKRTK